MDDSLREAQQAFIASPTSKEAASRFVALMQRAGAPSIEWLERVVRLRRLVRFPGLGANAYHFGVSIVEVAELLLIENWSEADVVGPPPVIESPLSISQPVQRHTLSYCTACNRHYYGLVHTCVYWTSNTANMPITSSSQVQVDGPYDRD